MEEIMQIFLRKKNRNTAVLTLFGVLVLLTLAPVRAQQQTLPALDQRLDPLRARFNQDIGKVRLIVLVDPTCPPCRWGASEIEKQVLETIPSSNWRFMLFGSRC
jgi:protein-disulfide isomerase